MMKTLSQIGGIVRYEALMQFRRRTLIMIIGLFTAGMIVLGSSMTTMSFSPQGETLNIDIEGDQLVVDLRTPEGEITRYIRVLSEGEVFPRWMADADVPMVMKTFNFLILFLPGLILLVVAIPPLITEVIPLDSRFKMDELIRTKPLSKAVYLIGKVLSVWLGFTVLIGLAAAVLALYGVAKYSPFDGWVYARFWLFGVLPLTLIVSGYAVLLGGLTRSRRVSLFIGLTVLPLSLWTLIGSGIFVSVMNFMITLPDQAAYETYGEAAAAMFNRAIGGLLPYAAVLIGIGVVMWGYTRVRDA